MLKKIRVYAAFITAIMLASIISVTASAGPLYVFYSSQFHDHMYTASESEKTTLQNHYYSGIESYAYQGTMGWVSTSYYDGAMPVYRFWNETTKDHFYTADASEKEQLQANYYSGRDDYVYEGIAFYASVWGNPVYRFFDPIHYDHFYTNDLYEKTNLCDLARTGYTDYQYEKVAWYE